MPTRNIQRTSPVPHSAGNTVWFDGVAEIVRRHRPRLVNIFAGAARTRGAMHLTMDANDAIEMASAFPHAKIATARAEGWAHFSETREELEGAFATLGLAERPLRLVPGSVVGTAV